MAQNSGLIYRGLLLLGMMLVLVTLVLFVVFRRTETPTLQTITQDGGLVVSALPTPGLAFPGQINWGALAKLSEQLPASPGWNVRYTATLALARAGSDQVPFDVLAQMLDEDLQLRNWLAHTEDGKVFVDEQSARRTVHNGLRGVVQWHEHKQAADKVGKDNPSLLRVYAAIDKLTLSHDSALQQEAETIKKKITSGKW
jgi:hypothetical protein